MQVYFNKDRSISYELAQINRVVFDEDLMDYLQSIIHSKHLSTLRYWKILKESLLVIWSVHSYMENRHSMVNQFQSWYLLQQIFLINNKLLILLLHLLLVLLFHLHLVTLEVICFSLILIFILTGVINLKVMLVIIVRGGFRGGRFDRGGKMSSSNFYPPPTMRYNYYIEWQICNNPGHSLTECRYRFTRSDGSVHTHHTCAEKYFEDSYDD